MSKKIEKIDDMEQDKGQILLYQTPDLTKSVTIVQSKADNASQVPGSNDNIPPES